MKNQRRLWVTGLTVLVLSGLILLPAKKGLAMAEKVKENKKAAVCRLPASDSELRKILSPEQYRIVRENGTEAPFNNAYWNNHRPGIYVDVITGEPLFSSTEKFDSGTGWPSFTAPIKKENIIEKEDKSHDMVRTEVRSKRSDSHLGHLFPDGPGPTGQRYCVNSAALKFIPAEDLEKDGYGQYAYLFKNPAVKTKTELAAFGGGCFWGVESAFRQLKGVVNTTVGYMGGKTKNPTYGEVCTDKTGYAETVLVEYDPTKVSYDELLEFFWSIHDPTTANRQGPDVGSQYRSVIFYYSPEQKAEAEKIKQQIGVSKRFKKPIVTEVIPAIEFYKAEEYHQQYYEKQGIKPTCHIPLKNK